MFGLEEITQIDCESSWPQVTLFWITGSNLNTNSGEVRLQKVTSLKSRIIGIFFLHASPAQIFCLMWFVGLFELPPGRSCGSLQV